MKRVWRVTLLLAGLAAAPGAAWAADCTLTFDARQRAWSVAGCDSKIDINGLPVVYAGGKDRLTVNVENINPLLYVGSLGEITTEKIEVITDLATIFLGFGGVFEGLVSQSKRAPLTKKDVGPDLQGAVTNLEFALDAFLREEAAMIASVQQLEFESDVTIKKPSRTAKEFAELYDAVRVRLSEHKDPPDAQLEAEAKALEPTKDGQIKYIAMRKEQAENLRKKARALLDKSGDVQKAVATTLLLYRRGCGDLTKAECEIGRRLDKVFEGARVAPWDEIATYPLTLSRQSPYSAVVVTDMPEKIETKFKVGSPQGSRFGAGIGLVTTDVRQETWAAVASAADPSKKVVTKTGDSARAAVKSLIATWAITNKKPEWPLHPLVEFGTSLESDAPGAFAGLAFSIGRYVRVGYGVTYQNVKVLDGQTANETVVADNAAIKTRDRWKSGRYWSVSINVTGLPLFSRD